MASIDQAAETIAHVTHPVDLQPDAFWHAGRDLPHKLCLFLGVVLDQEDVEFLLQHETSLLCCGVATRLID